MGIGNLGVSELLVVALLVLLLFGPRRLPEVGRTLGRVLRELRRGMNEVKRELDRMDAGPPSRNGDAGADRAAPRGRLDPPEGKGTGGGRSARPAGADGEEAGGPGGRAPEEDAGPDGPDDGARGPGERPPEEASGPDEPGGTEPDDRTASPEGPASAGSGDAGV